MKDGNRATDEGLLALARSVIEIEADAVRALLSRIDDRFAAACRTLLACRGRIVVCGVGKSGHIGHKIAATLASTGSPAFFVHAAEANHGDLGMLQPDDVVIAISQSGNSRELTDLVPAVKRLGVPLISLTGNADSPLARAADHRLDTSVAREACPLNLAPTASTTAALAMGDALAIALLDARGFDEHDFARSHPGGRLGRRLLLHVVDLMIDGARIPVVPVGHTVPQAVLEIGRTGLGIVLVTEQERLVGVFTDGDLRRTIDSGVDFRDLPVERVMTPGGQRTAANALAVDALALMREHRISALPVLDDDERVVGVLDMHALLSAGVI